MRMRIVMLRHRTDTWVGSGDVFKKNWWNKYKNEMKGDVGMVNQQTLWKQGTVYSLTRSLHPFFDPRGIKKDVVGTGLDCRLCLVSIMFADLPSLHPPSFH